MNPVGIRFASATMPLKTPRFGSQEEHEAPNDTQPGANSYRNWIDEASGLHVGQLKKPFYKHVPQDGKVDLARMVLSGPGPRGASPNTNAGAKMLLDAFENWPKGVKARFLNTSGGFAEVPLPTNWQGKTGWGSRPEDFHSLDKLAAKGVRQVITPDVREAALGKVDYILLAVDVTDWETSGSSLKRPHQERVEIYDVERDEIVQSTGKSYPLPNQEKKLILAPIESHLFKPEGDKDAYIVMGCNDTTVFNPRSKAINLLRDEQTKEFIRKPSGGYVAQTTKKKDKMEPPSRRGLAMKSWWDFIEKNAPKVAGYFASPHGTDTHGTWNTPLCQVVKTFPKIKTAAVAIGHYSIREPQNRENLEEVLEKGTRKEPNGGQVMDVVLNMDNYQDAKTGNPLW